MLGMIQMVISSLPQVIIYCFSVFSFKFNLCRYWISWVIFIFSHLYSEPPEEEDEPLIIVSTSITPVTLYIGESHNVFPDVTVQFEGDEGVEGTNLWEMEIWFNKNADGSGKKTQAATSTLTQSQKDQSLVITEDLVFEVCITAIDPSVGCT